MFSYISYNTYCASIGTNNSHWATNSSSALMERHSEEELNVSFRAFHQQCCVDHRSTYHCALRPLWSPDALWPKVSWGPLKTAEMLIRTHSSHAPVLRVHLIRSVCVLWVFAIKCLHSLFVKTKTIFFSYSPLLQHLYSPSV